MTTSMPFPIEFAIPPGWRAPQGREEFESPLGAVAAVRPEQAAVIAASGGFRPDDARLPEIADESIASLRDTGARVDVLNRTEVGTADSPGFAQVLLVRDSADASAPEIVQCQAFLAMLDVDDSSKRAVMRFVMTTTSDHVVALAEDFRQFLGTVRPAAGDEDTGDQPPAAAAHPVPRHTRSAAPAKTAE